MPKQRALFSSWKEIGEYLGVSERTAQRWESSGLPIHRPAIAGGHVLCYVDELDQWIKRPRRRK